VAKTPSSDSICCRFSSSASTMSSIVRIIETGCSGSTDDTARCNAAARSAGGTLVRTAIADG
jgi:hypothetical protein